MIKKLIRNKINILVFGLMFLMPFSAEAKVYSTNLIHITYEDPIDLAAAISGTQRARHFFTQLGYESNHKIKITFKDNLFIEYSDGGGEFIKHTVYGLFNMRTNEIQINSWKTDYLNNSKAFKMPASLDLHRSIVSHEVGHALLYAIAGKRGRGVNEYVAYVTQLYTMTYGSTSKILETFKDLEPHEPNMYGQPLGINSFSHAAAPHEFGIRSYLHFQKYGPQIFNDIVNGKFDPDKMIERLMLSLGQERQLPDVKSILLD